MTISMRKLEDSQMTNGAVSSSNWTPRFCKFTRSEREQCWWGGKTGLWRRNSSWSPQLSADWTARQPMRFHLRTWRSLWLDMSFTSQDPRSKTAAIRSKGLFFIYIGSGFDQSVDSLHLVKLAKTRRAIKSFHNICGSSQLKKNRRSFSVYKLAPNTSINLILFHCKLKRKMTKFLTSEILSFWAFVLISSANFKTCSDFEWYRFTKLPWAMKPTQHLHPLWTSSSSP